MKQFKDKWGMVTLYNICSTYLNNQTEQGAITLIEDVEMFKRLYPIMEGGESE